MNRRNLPPIVIALALAFCLTTSPSTRAADATKPNIIFILADDLGYGDLGCYGQKIIQTPHIDRLATEGMKFTSFYAGNAVCAPSRCTLMTGLHSGHAFVRDNRELKPEGQVAIPAESVTVAKVLKSAG
jgi:arylsulfatase A-like enzyme